jgi:hypothetical protein
MPLEGYQDRNEAFAQGHQLENGDPAISNESQSMQQDVTGDWSAQGTNQQIAPGQDAQSDVDYARGTLDGGSIPSQNGMSASTYAATRPLRSTSLGI